MTYVSPNFKSKIALKRAIAAGDTVYVTDPAISGLCSTGGECSVEGPHYPKPHTWYARVRYDDHRKVLKVLG